MHLPLTLLQSNISTLHKKTKPYTLLQNKFHTKSQQKWLQVPQFASWPLGTPFLCPQLPSPQSPSLLPSSEWRGYATSSLSKVWKPPSPHRAISYTFPSFISQSRPSVRWALPSLFCPRVNRISLWDLTSSRDFANVCSQHRKPARGSSLRTDPFLTCTHGKWILRVLVGGKRQPA